MIVSAENLPVARLYSLIYFTPNCTFTPINLLCQFQPGCGSFFDLDARYCTWKKAGRRETGHRLDIQLRIALSISLLHVF
jgi:hypothetical protein